MSHDVDSKSAAALLINPMLEPEPSAVDGPGGSGFGNTMASYQPNAPSPVPTQTRNPYRTPPRSPTTANSHSKTEAATHVRHVSNGSPNYRAEAFGDIEPRRSRADSHGTPPSYHEATQGSPRGSPQARGHHRRSSSLKERFPGDETHEPLAMLRRDSRKAYRSPHLNKRQMAGTDTIDRLDPAIGGRAYHHEGPYDAALAGRNSNPKYSPIAALETSNAEALKATPPENIRDALERHVPLDGVATVPPGVTDRLGRRFDYEEGPDVQHEDVPGFKFDGKHLKTEGDSVDDMDNAMKAHRIDDRGIEMQDRRSRKTSSAKNGASPESRPLNGNSIDGEFASAETHDRDAGIGRSGSLKNTIKKRIGSLRHKKNDD